MPIRLCRCAGWSVPLLFAYGINRFSHGMARSSLPSMAKKRLYILTNTNNAPPKIGAVEFLYAVPRNCFKCHLVLWLFSNKKHRTGQIGIITFWCRSVKPEDHWSCIAHLIAEDMLKSAVIEETTFKHSPWAGADNPFGPKFWCQQVGLITMVICCKFTKNPLNLWLHTHLFMI